MDTQLDERVHVPNDVVVRATRAAPRRGTALVALLAGGIAAAGSVMNWMHVPGGIVFTHNVSVEAAKGTDTPLGMAAAAAAVVLSVAAIAWALRDRSRRGPAVFVLLAGAAILGSAIFTLTTLDARFTDFSVVKVSSVVLPPEGVRQVVAAILSNATAQVRPGIGLILTVGAGGLALLAGLLGFALPRSRMPLTVIDQRFVENVTPPQARLEDPRSPDDSGEMTPTQGPTSRPVRKRVEQPVPERESAEKRPSFDVNGAWSFPIKSRRS